MATYEETITENIPLVGIEAGAELGLSPFQIGIPLVSIEQLSEYVEPEAVVGALLYDASVGYTDDTEDANDADANDVAMLPNPIGAGDAFLLCSLGKPNSVCLQLGTAGAGTYTIIWKYWNGVSWSNFSMIYDSSANFKTTGLVRACWLLPDDWEQSTIESIGGYWLGAFYVSGTLTTQPLGTQIWLATAEEIPPYVFPDTFSSFIFSSPVIRA